MERGICYLFLFLLLPINNTAMDLFALVRAGDLDGFKQLVSVDADLMQFRDAEDNTLLHCTRSPDMVAYLLSRNVHVNAMNKHGDTPLHVLLWGGPQNDIRVTELLLDHGADITLLNRNNQNPVHNAATNNSEFLVRLLSHVPRCALYQTLNMQQRIQTFQLLCCFKKFRQLDLPEVPKVIQYLLISFCMWPPYRFYDEQETVNRFLFDKLDVVKTALAAEDRFERTPGDLELRYWPEDRSKILDPARIHQFVQPIIESIKEVVKLKSFSYTYHAVKTSQSPSVVE